MNLKNLSLAVVLLAALAGLAAYLNRPTPPPESDPRVGQPLLATDIANATQSLTLTQGANTVTVTRDATTDTWRVSSFHDLPATVSKLRTFVKSLTDAKIDRVVTRNPERAARLELDSAAVQITTADGATWSVDLGKTAERGGRYVRFDDAAEAPAYLANFSGFLDTTGKNWAESKLVAVGRDDIASLTLTFADEPAVTLTRESATAPWVAVDVPTGKQVKVGAVSTLLSTASNLRFTDVSMPTDPDAVDAAAHARTLTCQTFAGETLVITVGRRPEQTVVKKPESTHPVSAAAALVAEATDSTAPKTGDDIMEDLTETIPAGPTFARVTGPTTLAPLADHSATLAFKISDYTFTSLPADHEALFEDAPVVSAAVETESTPVPAAPGPVSP